MFHIFAGVLNCLAPVVQNSQIVMSSYRYDIVELVNSIKKYNAEYITLAPTMLIDLLAYVEKNKITDLPLRGVQPDGAASAPEVVDRLFKVLPKLDMRISNLSTALSFAKPILLI